MSGQEPETLPQSDHHQCSSQTVEMAHLSMMEVTNMHIYHHPENSKDVNGFAFVVRDGEAVYTISVREGVNGNGVEPVDAVPYETGGKEYVSLIETRGEALEKLQTKMADIGPLLAELVSDMKS